MATEAHGEETGGLVFHPLDQFIVKPLFGGEHVGLFTITNVTLWLALAVFLTVTIVGFSTFQIARYSRFPCLSPIGVRTTPGCWQFAVSGPVG